MSRIITEAVRPGEVLLRPGTAAGRLELVPRTLAQQRSQGRGPRYRKLPNGRVRYPDWAIDEWLLLGDGH